MKNLLLVFVSVLLLSISTSGISQTSGDGMRVGRDANGNINNAMYYKGGQPLTHWVQTLNITQFNGNWPPQRVLDYLNQALEVDLDISLATSICLERIGDIYLETRKDFGNTEKFYLAATSILEEMGNTTRAAYMYYYLGLLYHDFNKPPQAEEYYAKSLAIYSRMPEPFSSGYSTILTRIYEKYKEQNDYIKATPYLETIAELIKGALGEEHEQMMAIYVHLGDAYWNTGREEEGVESYIKSIPLVKNKYGVDSKEYFEVAKAYADRFWNEGYKKQAEPLYVELLENNRVENFSDKLNIDSQLLQYYTETLEWSKMIPAAERLKDAMKNMPRGYSILFLGKQKGAYHDMVNVLGTLYSMVGEYDTAERYFLEYLDAMKSSRSRKTEEIGSALINLSMVYTKMYNLEKAKSHVAEGMAMLEQIGKSELDVYASGLSILGGIAMFEGEFDKAEEFMLKSQASAPRGGIYEPDYAVGTGTLATIYWYKGDNKNAEINYLEAINIFEESGYTNLREYANLMGNLSMVYSKTGDFESALKWNEKAIIAQTSIGDTNHPDFLPKKLNHSMYLEGLGRLNVAKAEALESNRKVIELVDQNLLVWSEKEMEAYIDQNIYRYFDSYHSMYYRLARDFPDVAGRAYDNQLFLKGLLLQSSQKVQQAVAGSNDSELRRLNERQQQLRAEMEAIYSVPANQRSQDPARLELEFDAIQKQIKQRLVSLGTPVNMLLAQEKAFLQVLNALKPDEAAIEFLSFKYVDIVRETDSIFYCALVLRPGYDFPKMVFLTIGNDLEPLIDQHPDQLYGKGNIELYQKVIEPLAPYLEGVKNIYYSPAGLLHRFSFPAIPLPGDGVLSDRYLLHNLASTRNLIADQRPFSSETGILYGGIDYNTDAATLARLAGNYQYELLADAGNVAATRNFRGSEWTYLPGTRAEAEQISQLLTRARIYSLTLTGQEATEESFKSLSGKSPSIIHIASHGFSFPPEEKDDFRREMMDARSMQTYTIAEHPLMRSGLVFSGANHTWAKGTPPQGAEDGILSAYELANLDLSNTRLVVLSACETGLGDIKGNEGVFGLQRALFMAGVNSMVVSLWEVPDMETMELMTLFYGHLVDGKPLDAAFHLAKEEMKSLYPGQPSLWAGFVLIR
jgi:CHAT domain-containing protein